MLQLRAVAQSRGAFVKIEPRDRPPVLDFGSIGRDSPLTHDYHSLVLLDLITDFPERGAELRALLQARRAGLDVSNLAEALWRDDGGEAIAAAAKQHKLDLHLLAGTLWVALKPLYEGVAAAFTRHVKPEAGCEDCPVCGGPAWARCGDRLRCAVCETMWHCDTSQRGYRVAEGPQARGVNRLYDAVSGQRLVDIEDALIEHAFDSGPLTELLQLLESPVSSANG
ncbi:MAG: hypothetical protein K8I27_07490 [Planctomycetes bacterium]|nr:hypothetical protein [Planctomycetota bacterium]